MQFTRYITKENKKYYNHNILYNDYVQEYEVWYLDKTINIPTKFCFQVSNYKIIRRERNMML